MYIHRYVIREPRSWLGELRGWLFHNPRISGIGHDFGETESDVLARVSILECRKCGATIVGWEPVGAADA